jgi:hypothetical protein
MQSQNNMQAPYGGPVVTRTSMWPSVAGMMGLPNAPVAGSTPAFRQGEGVQPTTPMTFDQFFQKGQANDTYLGRRLIDPNNPGLTGEQYRASEQERAQGDFDNYLNNFGQPAIGSTVPPQQIGDMFNLGANSPVIQSGVQPTTQGINQPQSPYAMQLASIFGPAGPSQSNNFSQEIGPAVRKEIIAMAQSNGGGMQGPQYNQPMQRYNEGPQRQFANEYQSQLYDTMKVPNQSPLGVGGLAALLQQR